MSQVPQPIIPPPPDLQPIVDKLAIYVAKNGPDFESIIIAKNDPRFDFLDPWNTHHSYYKLKKQEAERQLQLEKAAKAQGESHLKHHDLLFMSYALFRKYRKDSCISRTFLLKFWVKNRGCGLYTRPLI